MAFVHLFTLISFAKSPYLEMADTLQKECLTSNESHSTNLDNKEIDGNGPTCEKLFDGFSCWDETPANTTVIQQCPDFIIGFDPQRTSFKICLENGSWYHHPESQKPWTNYTTCIDYEDLRFRNNINNVYVGGYAASLVALILALVIFYYFRTLKCTRNNIHHHLFSSFVFNNMSWIVWYKTVIDHVEVVQENTIWCQVLHIITNYFMLASYFWMFIEGLHLHIVLVCVNEDLLVRWFKWIGWGLPLMIVAVYVGVRMNLQFATERCWIEHSNAHWILAVPVGISVILSLLFLMNVVRVLLTKMQPAPAEQPSVALRKAARATALLVPLFGVHFILYPYHPSPGTPGEKVYQIFSSVLTSFQGLCVAILYCYTNHDVKVAILTYIARHRRRNEIIAMTGITAEENALNTQELVAEIRETHFAETELCIN